MKIKLMTKYSQKIEIITLATKCSNDILMQASKQTKTVFKEVRAG